MFNLYQIVQGAQGGQAIANLALQFDLSSEEAGKAVNSLIPALSTAFVANAAFNNLGAPYLSTVFNWGRATLGTIPFVTFGAAHFGPEGGYAGIIAGAALFGVAAIGAAYLVIARLSRAPV